MKEIIILLGPPASGKGTQSTLLSKELNYESISTGALLREEIETGSDFGNYVASLIDNGNLVPDDVIFKVLKNKIENSDSKGFILDGFPRTIEQAEMFSEYLVDSDFILKKVLIISLSRETILERIKKRITCGNCGAVYNDTNKKPKVEGVCDICNSDKLINRKDDLNISATDKRIDIFKSNIDSIMSFYEKKSLIFLIDGLKDVNAINHEIVEALGKY